MTSPDSFKVPPSGVVVSAIASAFQLELNPRLDAAARKAASRFFDGQRIGIDLVRTVMTVVADALLETKLIPASVVRALERELSDLPVPEGQARPTLPRMLSAVFLEHCLRWDGLVGALRSASAPVIRADLAALAYLRMAVVDLSLRVGAARHHAHLDSLDHGEPDWADPRRRTGPLQQLIARCRPEPPTGRDLAQRLGVDATTVERWLSPTSPTRPTTDSIGFLADEFAERIPDSGARDIATDLGRHYSLAALADQLASVVGRNAVLDLARTLARLANRVMRFFDQSRLSSSEREFAQRQLILFGSGDPAASYVLNWLAKQEDDPIWTADLRAVGRDWLARLQYVAQVVASVRPEVIEEARVNGVSKEALEAATQLLQSSPEMVIDAQGDLARLPIALDPPLEAALYASAANALYMQGRIDEAMAPARRAVEKDPDGAEHWLRLAAILSRAGQVDEALVACRECLARRPGWETAATEIGIILVDAGRPAEAVEHLQAIVDERGSASSTSTRYHLAIALFRTKSAREALELLEQIVEAEPFHVHALDLAAWCCLDLGRRRQGKDYATRAERLGMPDALAAFQQGDAPST
jgi:tetratricopeptide (TPR) repeat protein